MNLLAMDKVGKNYGEKVLFREVCFGLDEGEKIGVVGINGSGKSTFLKLVTGREEPDEGQIIRNSRLHMEYLPQVPSFAPGATVLSAVLSGDSPSMRVLRRYRELMAEVEGENGSKSRQQELLHLSQEMDTMDAWTLESAAQDVLTRLGINKFDQPVSRLSGGQRKRVALAAALVNPADLLVLDEPTNHLDNQAIDWLERYLQRFKGALLMVTHDRYFLERVTNRIIEVEGAHLYSYPGNYGVYLERKLEREEIEAAMAGKKKTLLRKELAWIRRGARGRGTKQKARIERYDKLREDQTQSSPDDLQIPSAASRLGKKTIVLQDVFHDFGGRPIIAGYSHILDRNERLGIVGPNGIGKSTLLRIMQGELTPRQGGVEIGSTVNIGYFPQESTDLPDDMRVIDYIREAGEYLPAGKKMLSAAQMLETFMFPPALHWNTLGKLSGGEKRRLHLLRIIMGAPNVLLLDEPGNDLDIETLTILEDYLDDFPGAVVAVSHDRYFLDRTATKILAFEGGGKLVEYPGNYSDYLRYSALEQKDKSELQAEPLTVKKKDDRARQKDRPLRFSFKEQKEFAEIDAKIAAVEEELKDVDVKINEAASDYQQLEKLAIKRREIVQRQDALMERWVYLNELAEAIEKQDKR